MEMAMAQPIVSCKEGQQSQTDQLCQVVCNPAKST
jgi:hypothetical protein